MVDLNPVYLLRVLPHTRATRGLSKKEAGELSVMCPKSIEQELESGTGVARWFALLQLRFKY